MQKANQQPSVRHLSLPVCISSKDMQDKQTGVFIHAIDRCQLDEIDLSRIDAGQRTSRLPFAARVIIVISGCAHELHGKRALTPIPR